MSARKSLIATVVVSFAATVSLAAAPEIAHTPLPCVTPDAFPRITAAVPGPARVVFSPSGQESTKYYIPMQGEQGAAFAVLPQLTEGGAGVTYRISALVDGKEVSTPTYTAPAAANCTADGATGAPQIALGLTNASPSEAPCGFNCNGITGVITVDGVLKPNEVCTRLVAQANGGAAPAAPACVRGKGGLRLSRKTMGIGAASLIVVGGGLVVLNDDGNPPPTSSSRP